MHVNVLGIQLSVNLCLQGKHIPEFYEFQCNLQGIRYRDISHMTIFTVSLAGSRKWTLIPSSSKTGNHQ